MLSHYGSRVESLWQRLSGPQSLKYFLLGIFRKMLAHSWLSGFTETRVKWAIVSLERSFLCGFDFSSIRSKNCCIPTVCQTLFLARKDSWCFQTWRAPVLSVWTTVIPVTSIFHPKQLLTFFWLLPPSPPSRPKFHPFSTDTSSLLD